MYLSAWVTWKIKNRSKSARGIKNEEVSYIWLAFKGFFACTFAEERATRLTVPPYVWLKWKCLVEFKTNLRFRLPYVMSLSISFGEWTTNEDKSFTYTPISGRSFTSSRIDWSFPSKSRTLNTGKVKRLLERQQNAKLEEFRAFSPAKLMHTEKNYSAKSYKTVPYQGHRNAVINHFSSVCWDKRTSFSVYAFVVTTKFIVIFRNNNYDAHWFWFLPTLVIKITGNN